MATHNDCITSERTFQHLKLNERGAIAALYAEGYSRHRIADKLGRNVSTISRELQRGTAELKRSDLTTYKKYFPETGESIYQRNRTACGGKSKTEEVQPFLKYASEMIIKEKWSPDIIVGHSLLNGLFKRSEIVCAKSLYNYIDKGLLKARNFNLSLKLRRKPKKEFNRKHKRLYGQSIEARPAEIETRETFGNWEIDTVIGVNTKDEVLLTLTERMTRKEIIIPIADKTVASVNGAIVNLMEEYGDRFNKIFKTVTADNGCEFAELSTAIKSNDWLVYFAHPYSSFERGTNERHNGLIRRFIPKGKAISNFSINFIKKVNDWCNDLPRKILNYQTPQQRFNQEIASLC